MNTQLKPPDSDYQQAKLIVSVGPSLPIGKLGWVKPMEKQDGLEEQPTYQFVSVTNHDLVFMVFEGEFELTCTG